MPRRGCCPPRLVCSQGTAINAAVPAAPSPHPGRDGGGSSFPRPRPIGLHLLTDRPRTLPVRKEWRGHPIQAFIPGTPFLRPRPRLRQAEPPCLTPSTAPESPKCVPIRSSLQGLQLSEESNAGNRLLQRQKRDICPRVLYRHGISGGTREPSDWWPWGSGEGARAKDYFKECFKRYDSWDFLKNNIGGENWVRSR